MKRPNIIFILMDDLGWTDLGCYGSDFYETPHLDRLAQQSMRFTDAYAACPVCSPTRASIMTGKYPATLGLTDYLLWKPHSAFHPCKGRLIDAPYVDHLALEEKSIAAALREGGYTTWHVGKWHLGDREYYPDRHGFDVNIGGCNWGMPAKGYFSPWHIETLPEGPAGEYLTDRLTNEAIRLIENNDGKPFFLNLCHYAVHIPIQAKPEVTAKYEAKATSLGLDKKDPFELGKYNPNDAFRGKRIMRRLFHSDPKYAAMIQSVDEGIGRILETLDRRGLADNTIVIFTSDNGGAATTESSPTCNAPLAEGKGWMYEGGTRDPLLVKWPGMTKNDSFCGVPVTSPDFYPTLLEMAGLDPIPQQHCDGVSFASLLKGGKSLDRDAIFWHYPHYGNQGGTPGCSVRCGDYKLIEFFDDHHVELYNLRQDIGEDYDLAAAEPEFAKRLQTMLHHWLDSVHAKFPQPNPNYVPFVPPAE